MPCSKTCSSSRSSSRMHTSQHKLNSSCRAVLLLLQLACLILLCTYNNSANAPLCSSTGKWAGHTSIGPAQSLFPWLQLPGAGAAEFVDDLMRAASFSNAGVTGKMYDPANNWTTIRYGWKAEPGDPFLNGTWDAPEQQLQWWFGKRPLQTTVTKVNTPGSPNTTTFYKTRNTLMPETDPWVWDDADDYYDYNVEETCRERDADQADASLGTVYFKAGPEQCAGKVWIPEVVNVTSSTQWHFSWAPLNSPPPDCPYCGNNPYYMRNTYSDLEGFYFQRSECKTWWLAQSVPEVKAAYNLLRSMLLPAGTDITWNYTGPCEHQMPNRDDLWGAWRAFQGPTDDGLGPNAVYQGGSYPGPGPDMRHWDNVVDDVTTDYMGIPHYRDDINKMSMQQVRMGWFDRDTTLAESQWRFMWDQSVQDTYWTEERNSGDGTPPHWWMLAWCPHTGTLPGSGWQYGVTCTLSITPMQADVFADIPGCAESLPQGIPYITCRTADGTLLSIDNPTTHSTFQTLTLTSGSYISEASSRPASNIVAGVNFMLTRQDYGPSPRPNPSSPGPSSIDYDPNIVTLGTDGLLPDIPCNKRAYSARFGGRCAAPVVQYLAYDEAYHLPANAAKFGLPAYGGCLSGGLMRYLGSNANPDWNNYYSWWTPPFWPADAWYNLLATRTEADKVAARYAFLNDQDKLNSLFVYQEQFKVDVTSKVTGCSRIRMYNQPTKSSFCLESNGAILQHVTCDSSRPQQCFQIDGNLTTSARFMQLAADPKNTRCVGILMSPWPPTASLTVDSVRMLPCNGMGGYVTWRQNAPGGYILVTQSGCTGPSPPRECNFGFCAIAPPSKPMTNLIDTRLDLRFLQAKSILLQGRANYFVEVVSPGFTSYRTLRKFWLDSFESSAVDLRAHRTRFAPPGARQSPYANSMIDGNRGMCLRPSSWTGANQAEQACTYNAEVQLGTTQYTAGTCAADWLYKTQQSGTNTTRGPICYPGSSFMYTYVNNCTDISSDMRLTNFTGTPMDKCTTQAGLPGQLLVEADDLWSAMVSHQHDPCGWPFLECVADCSLPSDVTSKGWTVNANGTVMDGSKSRPVGCGDNQCDKLMQDPKDANLIGAIDWRNLTLYTPQLDFSAFRGAPGQAVWYLNLNYNMLGGNLTALSELPDIFPNLRHLGLAHCSAGKFSPEYSWQQAQMPYCHDHWQDGQWVNGGPNQACYCADSDWKNMDVIPDVGKALDLAESGSTVAARQAGRVAGVTRMLYGTIPSTWGRMPNGSLAAWSSKLISVNLAGHDTITGDLPAEWYNQAYFPNLHYLKLKGTQIRPKLSPADLTWNNQTTCGAVRWNDYSDSINSVYDVSKTCRSDTCNQCDWWPLRSAAPWYYSPVDCIGTWAWTPCNSTCIGGVSRYQFTITIPAANNGTCQWEDGYFNDTRTDTCSVAPCPVDCVGSWSDWTACSATCGDGVRSSTYTITTTESAGGVACPFSNGATRQDNCTAWDSSCDAAVLAAPAATTCNTSSDGTWVYTPATCNCTTRTRFETFNISASIPQWSAKYNSCAENFEGQNEYTCPPDQLVDCAGSWVWEACNNATCNYRRGVYVITQQAGTCGTPCSTANNTWDVQLCGPSCTINCTGSWGPWSDCNATCAGGNYSRVYTITTPAAYGGTNCSINDRTVEWGACNLQPCPINCNGTWGAWGTCNATCGGGNQSRVFNVTVPAAYGGDNCTAADGDVDWQACNTNPCPINCTGAWSGWGDCNATCGGGNMTGTFIVSQPALYGGVDCPAANGTVGYDACNLQPCPINCTGSWGAWDSCNATCGGGNQSRTFNVAVAAAYGGTNCTSENGAMDWQACNTHPCPINCTGTWSSWDTCNATCGGGNQSRTFTVLQPALYGGVDCSTSNGTVEYGACNVQPCPINCTGSWGAWDACNATCGGGNQSRTFTVSQSALYGGTNCTSPADGDLDWQACNTQPCPINCTGTWSSWVTCNATCGGGNQSRTFTVLQPALYGGVDCSTSNGTVEYGACNVQPCPINCTGSWGAWDACNATCGGGNQSRTFTVSQSALYGGTNCTSPADGDLDWQACNTQPCPINCTGAWSGWDTCNATCGGGNQSRTFTVTQPALYGGVDCSPSDGTVEYDACNLQPCPINCTGSWGAWDTCNATCGGGNQSRVFEVTVPAEYGGTDCEAVNGTTGYQACNTHHCPINCTGNWTDWSACNQTCGSGSQFRVFVVSVTASHAGEDCTNANGTLEEQVCNTDPCPVNCIGSWGAWDACNATCGGGNQSRAFIVTTAAAYGGTNCTVADGDLEWQACNDQPCPVNCTGSWGAWDACNATCGGGNQSRVFSVTQAAAYGGTNCTAADGDEDWQACNTNPCPVNCTGAWSGWDNCNATCGGGNMSRTFIVTQPALYGGSNCSTDNGTVEFDACNTQPCPINCTGSWGAWTTCNATCAGGNQSRVYLITQDAAYGGSNCSYTNGTQEEQGCNEFPCPVNCVAAYTAWSSCNKTCGGGYQTRVYEVSVLHAFGGTACLAANRTIDTQACNTAPCPVNCTGSWSAWGSCNVTCGGGNQSRTYQVTTPAVGGGSPCPVADGTLEWQGCNQQDCPPQLGANECPALDPTMYLPAGTAVSQLPVLISFPTTESTLSYCSKYNSTTEAFTCQVRLQALPVLQEAIPSAPPSPTNLQLDCVALNALTCRMVLPLGPSDARYAVTLLPDNSTYICTGTPQTLNEISAEVILDSTLPIITDMQLAVPPTTSLPIFQLLITFSEPISWLANTTGTDTASTAPGDATAVGTLGAAVNMPVTYSSSRLLLTNAALLNISVVSGTTAVLASGQPTSAASAFVLWFRSWSGAKAAVAILGPAYQDLGGNKGQQDTALQVAVPGTDLLQRASTIASAATAISATASALSAAAAVATSSGAGGATSLLRSVGHTQFLAMSVSLAVPWMPPEYLQLCAGLEWSNLVQPSTAATTLTSNSSTYTDQQLLPSRRRQLLGSGSKHEQQAVADWLDQQSRTNGEYKPSSLTRSSSTGGTLVFSSQGTSSNGTLVQGLTNALVITGTSRWPAVYSARELQLSIIVLFVVVVVASILQGVVILLWKVFKFKAENLPNLLRFPKPQVVVYTLLMVPVMYGGAKLLASPQASSADWRAGVATLVLIPLPVLAFWAYVLITWHRALAAAARGDFKRSRSSILRTYGSGNALADRRPSNTQRGATTLAVLGDDNPTLIIRDRKAGEEAFENFFQGDDSNSDEGGPVSSSVKPHAAPAAVAPGRPWKAISTSGAGGQASQPGGSTRRPAAFPSLALAGEQLPARSFRGAPEVSHAAGDHPLHRNQSLPGSAENDEEDAGDGPLGEGVEEEESSMAEAWQAARAAPQPISSWGGQATTGSSPSNPRMSERFQLSFSADGSGAPQGSGDGGTQFRRQGTWVNEDSGEAGDASAEKTPEERKQDAARSFLQRHGFLVDDLVGDEPEQAIQRSQWKILLLHVISILQRCLTAIMFGFFHFRYISITQLGMLIALHALFVGYLVVVRPYASFLLLLSDVLAYLCELTVLGVAVVLQNNPGYTQHQQLAHALITCYFFDVAAMVVPELMRYMAMAWAWWRARQQRQLQEARGEQGLAPREASHPVISKRRLGGKGGAVAGADGVVTVSKRRVGKDGEAAAKAAAAAALKLSGSGGK